MARGDLGVKTGRGFFDWTNRSADEAKARRDQFLIDFLRSKRAGPGHRSLADLHHQLSDVSIAAAQQRNERFRRVLQTFHHRLPVQQLASLQRRCGLSQKLRQIFEMVRNNEALQSAAASR